MEQIELRGVTKSFSKGKDRVVAVTNINLAIAKGTFLSITGASGSGKTTLLRLIGGLERPSAGSIWVANTDLSKLRFFRRRRFVKETISTMHRNIDVRGYRTALDMVAKALPRSVSKEDRLLRAAKMLERVDLTKRASHRPFQLSGGEQRRLALARALVTGRPIVLAEEPTGQVDPLTAKGLLELMREINSQSGTTFVIVTDSETLAREATRTIRLEEGRIVYDHTRTFTPLSRGG
ncbi:MAG TPA: ABC transporter ATP-binding protein [Chloroflexota bacterium]|nr:ABC transporter ATP-binding protein [Chloroflexota bacterium]